MTNTSGARGCANDFSTRRYAQPCFPAEVRSSLRQRFRSVQATND
ncbi:hypothetical protein [Nostoc sp. DSM 114161]